MSSSVSSRTSSTASVSELSRLVTHTAVSCHSAIVKRDPSQTVSRSERYLNDTGILKIHIIRKRYHPALQNRARFTKQGILVRDRWEWKVLQVIY